MIAIRTELPNKAALRAEAHARRDTITSAERERASEVIAERATSLAALGDAKMLGVYLPIWSEVDPRPIIDWAFARDIAVALPAVTDPTTMVFRLFRSGDELVAGRFGTRMPSPDAEIVDPDVAVVPMIAFDRQGSRLGHGRGFYDRAISAMRARGHLPTLVGVAFAVQEVAAIPAEPHDIRMDYIVTEREALAFRQTVKG